MRWREAVLQESAAASRPVLPLSASLHSFCRWAWQRPPALCFRLIYDPCRGGCITKISRVRLGHAAAPGHETAERCTETPAGAFVQAVSTQISALHHASCSHLFFCWFTFDILNGSENNSLPHLMCECKRAPAERWISEESFPPFTSAAKFSESKHPIFTSKHAHAWFPLVSFQSNATRRPPMQSSSPHSYIFSSDVMKLLYANVEKVWELKQKQISAHSFCNGTSSSFAPRCSGGGQTLTGPDLKCIISDESHLRSV